MNILKKNSGITLMEIILVVALIGITVPIVTILLRDSFRDSNKLSQKVAVQTSVTALMNKFEQTIKEADIPVSEKDFFDNQILILKPDGETLFTFNPDEKKVICEEKDKSGKVINTIEYGNISSVDVQLKSDGYGAMIDIKGGEGENIYNISNTYYSRNTVSSDAIAEAGKFLLTTVLGGGEAGNTIVETVSKAPNEEVELTVSGSGFNEWIVANGNVQINDSTAQTITFTIPEENVGIVADFNEII